ncbi:MAG: serine/threonine protein kinase [Gemmataceae bacterium]|nr:serine/threonine protein kinase [Gemmataceae bacterium]
MAVPQSPKEFLDLVRRSQLAGDDRLRSYDPDQFPTPRVAAQQLVDDGILTNLQAGLLLKGKWRNFIISGKYRLMEHIGTGGMGQVFLCEHLRLGRRVAIKVLPAERAGDRTSLERFYREAQAVAALNHPNIVRAHDIDTDGPLHFLVMEYVEGANLQDIVKRGGPLDVGRAVEYAVQAACGLQHAHEAGLIHRDVKPSNLLVDRAGQVKLLDLGLARFFGDTSDPLTRRTAGRNVIGTADYLAPEQARDSHAADIRSDIYALGGTLYFLLVGHPPFTTGTIAQKLMQHQSDRVRPIAEERPEVPAEVSAIVMRMLEKDPADRYQSCLDLIDVLLPLAPEHVPPPSSNELPKLSKAAMSFEAPSGRVIAPERSAVRSRPESDSTPPRGVPRPASGSGRTAQPGSGSTPRPRFSRRMFLAALLGGGGVLVGTALGRLFFRKGPTP